ncbi:MAG TPA: hypothetical protein VK506_16080 [Conexibacter sp.]|nr:hypothetical protein [Conexibacter sp.]
MSEGTGTRDTANTDDAELRAELPGGMDPDAFHTAVISSGYPLQAVVARQLVEAGFEVWEEWAYTDEESGARRTLDVVGEWRPSATPHQTSGGVASTTLGLLVECKQSQHPYVFVEAVAPPAFRQFPPVTGLGTGLMTVQPATGDGTEWRWSSAPYEVKVPITQFLELLGHEFVTQPVVVSSFTKAIPKGKKVEMSGEEPYRALLLPLTKALDYYWSHHQEHAGGSAVLRLPIAVAVVDAPMVLVRASDHPVDAQPVRWVRAVVRRPLDQHYDRERWYTPEFDVVDIVHGSFFERYLSDFVKPYGAVFWDQLTQHQDCVLSVSVQIEGLVEGEGLPDNHLALARPTRH